MKKVFRASIPVAALALLLFLLLVALTRA